jgi:FkbM family methyltransferase
MDALARTMMTLNCHDCDSLPKVADAGRILTEDGRAVQIMHNGLRVIAGGYHGDWMAHIIRGLRGHHEPQEELAFSSVLRFARHNSVMVELGAFWSYYTLWYLHEVPGSRAVCVEPDPSNLRIGRANAALNGCTGRVQFVEGCVGGAADPAAAHACETTGKRRTLPCFDMKAVAGIAKARVIEVLHIDAQGAELPFIRSMAEAVKGGLVRFLVASTHHVSISNSATTHEDCVEAVRTLGGRVLIEHDIQQSFSGDGLIVASFFAQDRDISMPAISHNDPAKSLFPSAAE